MRSLAATRELIQTCHLTGTHTATGYLHDCCMSADAIVDAARLLARAGFHLENITAADFEEGYQLAYHFDHVARPGRVCLRVMIPHEPAQAPTISHLFGGADWHERECADFYGINFTGHPNLLPLLLAPEQQGVPPLRKTPAERKSLYHVYPGRTFELISPADPRFTLALASGEAV